MSIVDHFEQTSWREITPISGWYDIDMVNELVAHSDALESLIRRNWNKFSHADHAELERLGVRFISEVDG